MNGRLSIFLALVFSLIVGVVIAVNFWQENMGSSLPGDNQRIDTENEQPRENMAEDDFKYDEKVRSYYGKLIVNGYAAISEMPEGFCVDDCLVYDYVFFNVLSTDNKFLDNYIEEQQGNSFVGDISIGLGCVENDILWRMNDSDEFGMQKYTDSPATSEAILNSSKENPITVELERYLYTGGKGAPDCYSHFAKVGLAK